MPIAFQEDAARQVARLLIEIKALHFNAAQPFIFTSGWASPVYIDCRKIISFPRARQRITRLGAELIERAIGSESLDSIVGGETAGIPFAAWLADALGLPMHYVRKQPKGFGRMAQIEGEDIDNARMLLVEDLTTDGQSKAKFCQALRQAGARVDHAFVVFHYGIFSQSVETMKTLGIKLHALATWWDVLAAAKESGYFQTETLFEVERFLHAPVAWSQAHGGAGDDQAKIA